MCLLQEMDKKYLLSKTYYSSILEALLWLVKINARDTNYFILYFSIRNNFIILLAPTKKMGAPFLYLIIQILKIILFLIKKCNIKQLVHFALIELSWVVTINVHF